MEFTREILEGLAAPFPDDEIEFLPRAQSGGKALGLPYIDARDVMRRLDAVVGPGGWSFDFDVLSPDGKMVRGKLTVLGVLKCDAGEASTEDEILKSAVSDALKRCAVHFGIGRYLYYLPKVWAPYDAQKRRFTEQPRLDRGAVERALQLCGVGRSEARSPVALRVESTPRVEAAPRMGARIETPRVEAPKVEAASKVETAPRTEPAPRVEPAAVEAPVVRDPEPAPAPRRSPWAAGTGPGASTPRREVESSGDRAASRASAASEAVPGPLACSTDGCGKALTKGQNDISVRAYGVPLCPACQKTHQRAA